MSALSEPEATPAALGYHMPAEWEPHEATWLAWPHEREDWPGKLGAVQWAYVELVRKIARAERVHLLVPSAPLEARALSMMRRAQVELDNVQVHRCETDRGWLRDTGPIFVRRRSGELAVSRFQFNGWARYANWERDARIASQAAGWLDLPAYEPRRAGRVVVLEGGAVDVNGRGTVVTTEECLLDEEVQVRNPGFTRADYEGVLREFLGARQVIWLKRGIAGDDTHGHVDDLCRFVGPRTLLLCRETNPADPNYAALEENRERLQQATLQDGSRPEVIDLPLPAPLWFNGVRLPASYANFYVANSAVLVPTFNDPRDREALGILADLFADREVVGIHAVDLVWGFGTLHCLTQQQPRAGIPLDGTAEPGLRSQGHRET